MLYTIEEIQTNLRDALINSKRHPNFDLCFLIQANKTLIAWAHLNNLLSAIRDNKDIKKGVELAAPFWEICLECGIELTEREKETIVDNLIFEQS